jgi:cytochrome c2
MFHRLLERCFLLIGAAGVSAAPVARHLHNVIGRKAGSLQNYGYSSAMKGADFVWDKEKLDRFIAKPDEVVPGNNMKPYGGLTSAEDRAKVIVFLGSLTTN